MASLVSKFSKLNPFSSAKGPVDDEDIGEAIDGETLAGGGHSGRETAITHQLRISPALRAFLVKQRVVPDHEASIDAPGELTNSLRSLLNKPHIAVPPELTDRSHPLPDYFISSSHNTYLLAHQLYGGASPNAYSNTLRAGARCVEIDAWNGDNKEEPKVTHGWTLTSNAPFRSVCETIRDVVDQDAAHAKDEQGYRAAPILISLENHCDAYGQKRLVDIMREVFGNRLLTEAIRDKGTREQEGTGEHVTLADLGSKICVIVEYHFAGEVLTDDEDDHDPSPASTEEQEAREEYKKKQQQAPATIIIPELAALGIYAQSVKPPNNAWFEKGILENSPHHPLINVSESGLAAHMPAHDELITHHNANHLMRVYPKGTRITSANLKPVPFWNIGAQICALNWQTFGASMQINEALFSGTDGFVLKPAYLRNTHNAFWAPPNTRKRLRLHVAGASDVPLPHDRSGDEIKPYVTCTLVHPLDMEDHPPKRKTKAYRRHKLELMHRGEVDNPPPTDPIWDEVLEWEYSESELVFLRVLIKSDDAFARNPIFAVNAVRLLYVQPGWSFIRMLDLKGHETRCCLLVKFEITNA